MPSKPHLRIIAGRPVTVSAESPQIAEARRRFSLATGEKRRLFNHELGSNWQAQPERVLTRWTRKESHLNVRGPK